MLYWLHFAMGGINKTSVTSGAGTAYPSGKPEFTASFQWDSCYPILSFMSVLLIVVCPSFGHCVACSSSIYGFWLHLWYLQTLLPTKKHLLYIKCSLLWQCLFNPFWWRFHLRMQNLGVPFWFLQTFLWDIT